MLTVDLARAMLDIWAARQGHSGVFWPDTVLVAAQRQLAWEASQVKPIRPDGVHRVHQQIRDAG